MSSRPTLYILDAYSIIFQVYHAIPTMTGPSGQPTNASFGIFRDLLNLIKNQKPDSMAAAFDGPGPVFRSELYAEYKAQRAPMPEELASQISVIRRVFEGFCVPILEYEGAEADDVIATLTHQAVERGFDVFICTSDKDARQLLGPHVSIFNLRKQQVLDVAALEADWGVRPDQVVDLLALTGDTVDNVPGVPGIGIKTAADLLKTFDTLENLLNNIAKVSGAKRKENLYKHAETARRARVLVELKTDLPIPIDWDQLKCDGQDVRSLKKICIESGFHRFLDEIGEEERLEVAWDTSAYVVVDTPEKLHDFAGLLKQQTRFSFDTETTSLDPLRAELVGMSFSWKTGEGYYVPVRGPDGEKVVPPELALQVLGPIITSPDVELVGQNLKYDALVLSRLGMEPQGPITDTMVLSYLLESGERNHNLDELSRRLLDHTMIPISSLIGKGKNQITIDQVPIAQVAAYAGEDADAAWRLDAILRPRLVEEGLWRLYADLERPLILVLARMEQCGIKVDVEKLQQLSADFATRLVSIRSEVYELAGHEFNIGSPLQLRKVLFEELGLKSRKKTGGGEASTDAEVLEELASQHPLPRLIVQHRQLDKLKGTYLDALPALVHPDGRIHASFNQVVAATGRLSSSDPNLQNIPVRTEDGRQIRQAFVPGEPGWQLLTADYSQVELRVLAHYSQDPALVEAFDQDRDIHTVVAAEIFRVPQPHVSPEQRRMAKTVNFGVIYGLSAFGLASRLGISQSDATRFIEAYFQEYEGVDRFITETLEQAARTGRVETILGRRRAINGIKNTTGRSRNLPERTAINTVIQGSAADLIKQAMLDIDRELRSRRMKSRMLLQIHDELVFEAPESEIEALSRLVDNAMTSALPLRVPLKVDLAAGPNWLDVQYLS